MKKDNQTYCLYRSTCAMLQTKKIPRDSLDNYLCCHYCKDMKCENRCKDNLDSCKFRSDKEYTQTIIDRQCKPFAAPAKPVDSKPHNNIPKTEINVERSQDSKATTAKQPDIVIPQNKAKLARLLGISYDKVAYRIEVKHQTYEQVYEEFKK